MSVIHFSNTNCALRVGGGRKGPRGSDTWEGREARTPSGLPLFSSTAPVLSMLHQSLSVARPVLTDRLCRFREKKHYSPESCVRGDVYRSHLMLPCALGLPAVALTHIGLLHCPAVVKTPPAATLVAVAERQAGLAAPLHHPGSIRYRRRHHRRRSPRNRSRRSPCHRPGDCRPSSSSRC